MDNLNKKKLIHQVCLKDYGITVDISQQEKEKIKFHIYYRIFGMNKQILPEEVEPIPMSLIRVMDLVKGHKWRTQVVIWLITYMKMNNNTSTLPLEDLLKTTADKQQFSAASKFLSQNNIAIKLTQTQSKKLGIYSPKNTWLLNPYWVYSPKAFEIDCLTWKLITGREP